MKVFIVLITNEYEKKKEICEFEMHLKKLFYLRSILSNDEIVSALRPGLKKGVDFLRSVLSGVENDFLV